MRQDVFLKFPTAESLGKGGLEHRRRGPQDVHFEQTVMKTGNTKPCLCLNRDLLAPPGQARRVIHAEILQPGSVCPYRDGGSHEPRPVRGSVRLPRDTLITRSKRYQ
jgi:hypothetical protein